MHSDSAGVHSDIKLSPAHCFVVFKKLLTAVSVSATLYMYQTLLLLDDPKDGENMLSFVDYRRFGRWVINGEWGKDRGPDPISQYDEFRQNILHNLENSAFERPICEIMLNQKYFNGIGNYLRAEILFRNKTRPFDRAKDVLAKLLNRNEEDATSKCKAAKIKKDDEYDLLQLCNIGTFKNA